MAAQPPGGPATVALPGGVGGPPSGRGPQPAGPGRRRRRVRRFMTVLAMLVAGTVMGAGLTVLAMADLGTGGVPGPLVASLGTPAAHSRLFGEPGLGAGQQAGRKPSSHRSRTSLPTPGTEPSGLGLQSGVIGGALFGGNTQLAQVVSSHGITPALVRVYYRIGENFPNQASRALMAQGSSLLVSLDTIPGADTYAQIAAGREDAAIVSFLKQVEQTAVSYHLGAIYLCFEHEVNDPGTHSGLGTPAQFVAAWDHIHQLAVDQHVDWNQGGRVHWVWILSYRAFIPLSQRPAWMRSAGVASDFWPGTNEVDVVGGDGYNGNGCNNGGTTSTASRASTTPAALFGPILSFANAHSMPMFITEWGSSATAGAGTQTAFIQDMRTFVTQNREIAAAMYWSGHAVNGPCNFSIGGNPSAVAAMVAMAHSGALAGQIEPVR